MKEKDLNSENNRNKKKLAWEAPKLYCLDKRKTDGGSSPADTEDTFADLYNVNS